MDNREDGAGDQDALDTPQRLRLLVDLYAVEHGAEPTFSEISAHLEAHGISLSRSRWSYMLNGHREVTDRHLLASLAEFFGVQPEFLLSDGPLPERVQSQLELIRAMRISRVRSFAARTLGDVSPRTLDAITRFLDEEAAGQYEGR
ncbi:hypothetical protein [uncultured Brevibacterium sp.]|uniref:hypothetical protein n=1 Tax=uncultured Brevibacterium sp. TaxID=189678 RepID=UPI0025D1BDDD|nr:hypothetical protein [uncultured Brevibacterium sp.]